MQYPLAVDLIPGIAAVVGPVQAALIAFGFDDGPNASRTRRRSGDADFAHAVGQSPAESLPALAAVNRTPDAAAGATGAKIPGRPAVVPHRSQEDARIAHVERQVHRAGRAD